MQRRLHCSDSHAERVGDLGLGNVLVEAQHDNGSPTRRKTANRRKQLAIFGGGTGHWLIDGGANEATTTEFFARGVDDAGAKVRARLIERVPFHPDAGETLLHDFLGNGTNVDKRNGETQRRGVLATVERRRVIHRRKFNHHPSDPGGTRKV
jgi:hypothetical protein